MERNGLSNFGRGSPKELSGIIISKSMHWLKVGACSRYTDSVKKIFLTDFG